MGTISGKIYSTNRQASLDAKYGPYASVDDAFDQLYAENDIAIGLTVGIQDPVTGKIEDYWFYGGTDKSNLVVKLRYDGSFLTVNGESWQLNLSQPKCLRPDVTAYIPASQANPHPYGIPNLVEISTRTEGATIIYTKAMYDEATGEYAEVVTPTLENSFVYTGPITVNEGEKYKLVAVAVKEGWLNSDASAVAYVEHYDVPSHDDSALGTTQRIDDNGRIDF